MLRVGSRGCKVQSVCVLMRHMSTQMATDLGSTLAKATNTLASQLLPTPTGQTPAAATVGQPTPQVRASC